MRGKILGDNVPAMPPNFETFLHSLPELGHGIIFQETKDPDELFGPFTFLFFLRNQPTA
jgi:hypothetical protein